MTRNVADPIDDPIQWEGTFPLKHIILRLQFQQLFQRGSTFPGRLRIIVNMNSQCLQTPLGILCEAEGRDLCMNLKSKPHLTRSVTLSCLCDSLRGRRPKYICRLVAYGHTISYKPSYSSRMTITFDHYGLEVIMRE